jgi:hypothetical protein
MRPEKPRERSGYTREETELVLSACLTVAGTLGGLMDDLCIVGGLVPTMIVDLREGGDPAGDHPGTLDLDIGLALALLRGPRYAEVRERLVREDFEPDLNDRGNESLQRWVHETLGVTIDFLLPPNDGEQRSGWIQALRSDFGAIVTRGLELAFEERVPVALEGLTLRGERTRRVVPVCGPGAFVVLKAFAFADRSEPKDALDLVYTLRGWREGIEDVADRITRHANGRREVVRDALALLARDFETVDSTGPARVAAFEGASGTHGDEVAADARGAVDDLLRLCEERGLIGAADAAPPPIGFRPPAPASGTPAGDVTMPA